MIGWCNTGFFPLLLLYSSCALSYVLLVLSKWKKGSHTFGTICAKSNHSEKERKRLSSLYRNNGKVGGKPRKEEVFFKSVDSLPSNSHNGKPGNVVRSEDE